MVTTRCAPLYGGRSPAAIGQQEKRPEADADATVPWVEECGKGFLPRRQQAAAAPSPRDAAPLLETGQVALATAKRSTDPAARSAILVEAVSKLQERAGEGSVQRRDHRQWLAAPTRASCARAVRWRCSGGWPRSSHPDYTASARRVIDAVLSDGTFAGFRSDADSAVGR
ncbi:MAG: hypothetical protein R2939_11375 [Kofleriaceae bacterium]